MAASFHHCKAYEKIPSMPIDKAVMERATRIAVVPCDPGWTDLGSWQSIWEQSTKDERGNAKRGDVLLRDVTNCLVHGSGRLVACAGINDLAVIETADSVLVVGRERSEPVKQIVADLNSADRHETIRHLTVDHRWGRTRALDDSADGAVRELEILPGRAVDLESGQNRSLHLLVTFGEGALQQDDERRELTAGGSFNLEAGTRRRACKCRRQTTPPHRNRHDGSRSRSSVRPAGHCDNLRALSCCLLANSESPSEATDSQEKRRLRRRPFETPDYPISAIPFPGIDAPGLPPGPHIKPQPAATRFLMTLRFDRGNGFLLQI